VRRYTAIAAFSVTAQGACAEAWLSGERLTRRPGCSGQLTAEAFAVALGLPGCPRAAITAKGAFTLQLPVVARCSASAEAFGALTGPTREAAVTVDMFTRSTFSERTLWRLTLTKCALGANRTAAVGVRVRFARCPCLALCLPSPLRLGSLGTLQRATGAVGILVLSAACTRRSHETRAAKDQTRKIQSTHHRLLWLVCANRLLQSSVHRSGPR
jgi:hypothetical protein